MAPTKLRDLIRNIRACKTQQEEREVIRKESASIREGFRKEDHDARSRNICKLLYIHMLGYPAHFGQLECLKLVTSNRFHDKRMGYLGAMMLLDELKEVSMLITNSLKNDLGHSLQYVSGMALCALGSICSVDMGRDLVGEIEKLLKSTNSYVRKKAVLCAVRIVRKVPELMDNFVPATRSLLGERNHGVLITGVTLIHEMCLISPEQLGHFRRLVPSLIKILKNLLMTGYSPEHDVSGATDPFLQCKVIRLLRCLCAGDVESSEMVNDILAQVATNTDTTKTVGNAILYETVLCIMDIHAESGLRVLAINSLGKFLQNPDRNIRYVALSTLLATVQASESSDAVQRHRATIIDCLSEPDVTIRRRALVLIFALINKDNIENLVSELLEFLAVAEAEFKMFIVTEIFKVSEKFATSPKWHVNTCLSALIQAGEFVPESSIPPIVHLFQANTDLHAYIVQRCYSMLEAAYHKSSTAIVASYCIGEFGDLLLGTNALDAGMAPVAASASNVIDLLYKVLTTSTSTQVMREYAFTAMMKLSTRMPTETGRIKSIVQQFGNNTNTELQQRSTEYSTVFRSFDHMRLALLERMPLKERAAGESGFGGSSLVDTTPVASSLSAPVTAPVAAGGVADLLGDLMGDGGNTAPPVVAPVGGGLDDLLGLDLGGGGGSTLAAPMPAGGGGLMDLTGGGGLMDLMGGGVPAQVAPATAGGGGLMDLMGGGGLAEMSGAGTPAAAPAAAIASGGGIPPLTAWNSNGLQVQFQFNKDQSQPMVLQILLTATNSTAAPMNNFSFQIAVPKTHQLQLQSPSSTTIPPMGQGNVTQRILVNNPQQIPIRMRVKIAYDGGSGRVDEMGELPAFPPGAL